jgi:3-oxoacid CoA-transferase subunit A
LLRTRQVKKMISSYVGENKEFERQYLAGELEWNSAPRARWPNACARAARAFPASTPRPAWHAGGGGQGSEEFRRAGLRPGARIFADLSLVKAWKADESGNVVFRKTARNFNVPAATCGKVCVVEVEEIVPTGSLDPDGIHLPGVYVQRLVLGAPYDKKIEFRTTRARENA